MRFLIRKLKDERGIALVITIAMTMLLVAVALELNKNVRTSVFAAAAARDRVTLSYMASSGIHAGMMIMIADKKKDLAENKNPVKQIDTVQEDWADPEKLNEILSKLEFEEGKVTLKITDELGKIQVNALVDYPKGKRHAQGTNHPQERLWDNILRPIVSLDPEAELNATTTIISCMIDWLDFGDDDAITGINGAESDYYEGLDPPYSCKNGPFTHLGELMLIKNIKPEYFTAINSASIGALTEGMNLPGGLDPSLLTGAAGSLMGESGENGDGDQGALPDISIDDLLTVHGRSLKKKNEAVDGRRFTYAGKININTAPLPVLMALLPPNAQADAMFIYNARLMDKDSEDAGTNQLLTMAEEYKDVLNLDENLLALLGAKTAPDLSKPGWYKDYLITSKMLGIPASNKPKKKEKSVIPDELITLQSDIFRLESTATLHDITHTIVAVIERVKDEDPQRPNPRAEQKYHCKVLSWEIK